MDLLKIFQRDDDDPETRLTSVSEPEEQVVSAITEVLTDQLEAGGIPPEVLDIDIRCLGRAADGRQVYQGHIRLSGWQRQPVLRLLLGFPMLQAKVRRMVRASWINDLAHFTGLWLHPSAHFEESGGMHELRSILQALERASPPGADSADQSFWSLPHELRDEEPGS